MDFDNFDIGVSVVAGVFLVLFIIIFAIVINLHFKVRKIIHNKFENQTKVSRPQTKYEPAKQNVPRQELEMIPKSVSNPRNTHQYQPDPQGYQPPASQPMPNKYKRTPSNDYKTDDFNTPPDFNNRWQVERQNSDRNASPLRDSNFRNPLGGQNRNEMDNRFNYTDPRSLQNLNRPNTSDIGFGGIQSQNSRPMEPPMGNNFPKQSSYPRRELHY